MTTVQITMPEVLAQDAQAAGLFSPAYMQEILREQLRRRAGESLQTMWRRMPEEELTPEIEQQTCDDVREVRAQLDSSERMVVKELLDGMLLKHQARRLAGAAV
jgi:hypothetical protein